MLGSMDSALPPKSERPISLRRPLRQLSLGQDPLPASPLISTRNLVPGLSDSVVKLDRLGKGATSNVFRAVHAATLKMVALKEVTVSTDADRRAVRTEMRALRTQRSPLLTATFTTELASCPRIVDYYGSVVQENGNACIAVEYVAGGSLGSWLDSGGLCPEAWIAHIAHQALEALEFVHSGGRVHRDVKPANLLITRKGDLKLADFGAAGVENSSRMVGTQRFMAPERLKGRRATAQSDLWSFGLSLATAALGGDFMAHASNEFEQLDLAGRARSTLAKATTLSAELRDFLHRCLSRDPARRPALRDLMKHPFLEQRHNWASKCPEVTLAMRDRKRRQREAATALSTDAVLTALCEARAEDNLISSRVDTTTAADLAYELGVTAKSLVRNVHRRTLDLIRERGGGLAGVSDSGGDNGDDAECPGSGRGRVGSGIASDARARRRRRDENQRGNDKGEEQDAGEAEEERGGGFRFGEAGGIVGGDSVGGDSVGGDSVGLVMESDGSWSPVVSPPVTREASADGPQIPGPVAPFATVGGSSSTNSNLPPVTPRNRKIEGREGGGTGTATFGSRNASSISRRRGRKAVEMPSAVKLTPRKRRGERKSSRTKRHGSRCADAARRARDQREPERGTVTETSTPAETPTENEAAATTTPATETVSKTDGTGGRRSKEVDRGASSGGGSGSRRASGPRKKEEKPRTAASRILPSRTDVSLRSVRNVYQVADAMKAQINVRDRVHRLRVYPNCFSGREAVQWMLDGCHASSVIEAERLGNEMMKASVFQHILNSHLFEDSSVYYQFTDGETPPPPARGGKRLRQIARVFRGHVARKFVPNGGGTARASPASGASGGFEPSVMARDGGGSGGTRSSGAGTGSGGGAESSSVPSSLRKPPRLPKSGGIDRSKHRRSRGRQTSGASTNGSQSQLRRFSSSMSTVTVPETPY